MDPINISTSPALFPWRPAAWLRVTGTDAFSFLQGQCTADLRALDSAPAVYGLWLTVKGKVLADSFVLRRGPDEFWVGSYFSPAATVRERLESFIIADDVAVEDHTEGWRAISVAARGPELPPDLNVFAFPGRRDRAGGWEYVFPAAAESAVLTHWTNAPRLGAAEMERRRIEAGIPAVPQDIGPGELPNEAQLEAEALSYTKGCYLGQEVMARLKSMGQVRRRLLRVEGTAAAVPPVPTPVFAGEKQVGDLRSVAPHGDGGFIGLALLSLLPLAGGAAELHLGVADRPRLSLRDPL